MLGVEMKHLRLVILLFCLLLTFGLIGAIRSFYRNVQGGRNPARGEAPEYHAEQLRQDLRQAEAAWPEIDALLRGRRYREAGTLYSNRVIRPLRAALDRDPGRELPDGTALDTWLERQRDSWDDMLDAAFTRILRELETADIHPNDATRFFSVFERPGWESFRREAEARIRAARIENAGRWMRVVTVCNDPFPGLEPLMEETLRSHWDPALDRRLVFGPALSEEEQEATWGTLRIDMKVDYATFTYTKPNALSSIEWDPPPVPIMVACAFTNLKTRAAATSWDRIEPVHVWLHPPKVITRRHADAIIENYRKVLVRELGKKLEDFPDFRIDEAPEEAETS